MPRGVLLLLTYNVVAPFLSEGTKWVSSPATRTGAFCGVFTKKVGTPAASVSPSRLLRWWLGCGAARAAISRKHAQRANEMMTHARFNDHFCMYLICSSTRCYVCITLRYLYCVDTI